MSNEIQIAKVWNQQLHMEGLYAAHLGTHFQFKKNCMLQTRDPNFILLPTDIPIRLHPATTQARRERSSSRAGRAGRAGRAHHIIICQSDDSGGPIFTRARPPEGRGATSSSSRTTRHGASACEMGCVTPLSQVAG